jgi:hypothetical protein
MTRRPATKYERAQLKSAGWIHTAGWWWDLDATRVAGRTTDEALQIVRRRKALTKKRERGE